MIKIFLIAGAIGATLLLLIAGGSVYEGGVFRSSTNNSTGNGSLCEDVPAEFQEVFLAASDKWKIQPAFLAAIHYQEQGKTWKNINGPWAENKDTHATGPFQFLPNTWESYKQDGNGDGTIDINNIWDAAFGAAKKLAMGGAGGNTTDESKLHKAAWYYNHADWYADEVIEHYHKFKCDDSTPSNTAITEIANGSSCSQTIIDRASYYKGTYYSKKAPHCGRDDLIGRYTGLTLDCSGYVSRVYRELDLFGKKACYSTTNLDTASNTVELFPEKGDKIVAGDYIVQPGHAMIFLSGDPSINFKVWSARNKRKPVSISSVDKRSDQRFFRSKKCSK